MTQNDPSPPPMPGTPPYAAMVAPPVDPRPGVVRALCIIGFILAALKLLTPLMVLGNVVVSRAIAGPTTSPAAAMQMRMLEGPLLPWTIVSNAINLAIGAWLLWAALAAWRLRPAGRRGMLSYAVADVVWVVVGGIYTLAFVMPAAMDAMTETPGAAAVPGFVRVMAMVGASLGVIVALIYPACVWIFMRRPDVVAAYGNGPPGGTEAARRA